MIDKALLALPDIRKKFPFLTSLSILQALVIVGQAIFLSAALTALWQGEGLLAALTKILGFLLCFMARELVNFFRLRFLDGFAYRVASQMRRELLEKLFLLGPSGVQEQGAGVTATTAISGIEDVETYVKLVLSKVLNMMMVPLLLLVAIFFLDGESALILAITFPFAIVFMILLGYAAQARADKQYRSFQRLSNHFLDALRGIATLKYFGRSKEYANSIYLTSERFRKATMATLRVGILSTFALDFFATLSVASVALFLGLKLMDGHILLFPALATLILAPEYFLPLREFASDYHATLNGKNAMEAVQGILAHPVELNEVIKEPVKWTNQTTLTLSNWTKIYETGRGVTGINLRIEGFKKIGLVGASGSGKSTLLATLSGFLRQTEGQVLLDGLGLPSLADKKWRESLSFIPQNTYIFSKTLRENLSFYQPGATDTEILEAARLAGLKTLIDRIGLDAQIGSGGRTLSGGQMQRVALSRAFLARDRNIVLLDEPTAHLDIETELEVKAAILPLLEEKLVFLATHRLHWLPQMDLVLVLNEGRLAGLGSHEELLAHNQYYQRLIKEMEGQ